MRAPTIRLAILECDTPLSQTRSTYGSYGGVFKALLDAGAKHIDLPVDTLQLSTYDVVEKMEYPDLADIDAVLMTGSRFNSYDDIPWVNKLVSFTQSILAQSRVRIVGICYGHQIVGRAMGVKVGKSDRGWEASVCQVQLTEKGKAVFGKDALSLHQMHKDIVYSYPPEVQQLGHSPKCEVQGMLIPSRLITVQGHPEFNQQIVTELLDVRHEQKIFDDQTYQDSMSRVGNSHDGVVVAGAILRFLLEGR